MKNKISGLLVKFKQALRPFFLYLNKAGAAVVETKNRLITDTVRKVLKKAALFSAILLLVVETVFAFFVYGYNKDDKITRTVASVVPYPVAIANQYVITYRDYLRQRDYIHHFYQATDQANVDLAEVDKQVIDQLIENKIIAYQASVNGIKISKKEVDESFATIIDQNGGEEKVVKVLFDLYGLDIKSFRILIKDQLVRDKINEDLIMRVQVSHILIRVEAGATAEKTAEAKKRADDLVVQARGGADFVELAKKNSEDVNSSDQGGVLKPFARGEMVEAFSNAAFDTAVGSISDAVQTDYGWHIIKVEAKTGKIDKTFNNWLTEAKKSALIIKF